jgi:hypothetical protein
MYLILLILLLLLLLFVHCKRYYSDEIIPDQIHEHLHCTQLELM